MNWWWMKRPLGWICEFKDPNVLELTESLCLKLVDLCRWLKIPKMWKMSWKRTFRQHPDKGFINYSPKTSLISFYSSLSTFVLFAYALPLPQCMLVCLCTPQFVSLPNLVQVRRRQTKWMPKLLRRIASWNSEPLWYFWIGMNLFLYTIVLDMSCMFSSGCLIFFCFCSMYITLWVLSKMYIGESSRIIAKGDDWRTVERWTICKTHRFRGQLCNGFLRGVRMPHSVFHIFLERSQYRCIQKAYFEAQLHKSLSCPSLPDLWGC